MIDPESVSIFAERVESVVGAQKSELMRLRQLVRPLRAATERIKPRSTTAISIVGMDGGNNQVEFDPFLVQIVRVVDSSDEKHCLDVVSPQTDLIALAAAQFEVSGKPLTALGRMMQLLGVRTLHELSKMIPSPPTQPKPSWISVYRELHEWAVLLDLVRNRRFPCDTVVLRDGWLRTKVFATDLFRLYQAELDKAIDAHFREQRRRILVAGVLKRSKVLQKYRLPMMLEGVLRTAYPAYVKVPKSLQAEVFEWDEIVGAVSEGRTIADAENMVAGEMYFAKFGARIHDPAWVVDLLRTQEGLASTTFGYLLADALEGFPRPFFPMSLQRAHEHAAIGGMDLELFQQSMSNAVRKTLGSESPVLDECELLEDALGA